MRTSEILFAVLLLALLAPAMFAQGNTGAILGTITDSSQASVPGAKIIVTNTETGVASSTATDGVGNYALRFLQPGRYRVEAEATGFKKLIRDNVVLDVARELRVDFTLEPGALVESVTITGTLALVETETGALSSTLESRQVVSLPLLSRDPTELANLSPGVVVDASGFRMVSGGQVRQDPYYLDGTPNNTWTWNVPAAKANPDVIGEFKVLTNSFSAEYGETSGSVLIGSMKSGTNEVHGSLFEFFRNEALNAGNFFTHQRPVERYHQAGGTVGGPIIKSKTFFFFGLQYTHPKGTSVFTNYSVPLPEFRSGNFSRLLGAQIGTDALGSAVSKYQIYDPLTSRTVQDATGKNVVVRTPFSGNLIPSDRISPAAKKIQALYPAPQVNTPFSNYNGVGPTMNNFTNMDVKGDHNFTDRDKLMLRYSYEINRWLNPEPFPEPGGGSGNVPITGYGFTPRHATTANYVRTISARATNSLHLGWWQVYTHRDLVGSGKVSTNDLGIFGLPNGALKLGTPSFNFSNFSRLGSTTDTLSYERLNSRSIVNMTSIALARHTIKFGGEARQIASDTVKPGPSNTSWTFSNLFTDQRGFTTSGFDYAGFLLGLPQSMSYTIYPDFFKGRSSVYALFVQDDVRVSRKLTVNIGLRWDAPLWFHELHNRSGVFLLSQGQYVQFGTNALPRTTAYEQNWKNFGPRFGFAYSPFGNSKTVIRGGYGLFSVGTGQTLPTSPIFADADGGRYNTTDQVNWRTTLDSIPYIPQDKIGKSSLSVSVYPDKNRMAYMQQWNFNIGHDFKGVLVEAGYAGSKGTHLSFGSYNANAIPLSLASVARGQFIAPYVPYPLYPNGVTIQSWIGSSFYNSLQIRAEKRFSGGLGFVGTYTWQKTISVGDGGYRDPVANRNLDRGLSGSSVPQRLALAWNYELPFGKGRNWLTSGPLIYPLGGWELSGIATFQSGYPLTPGISYNSAVNGGTSRPTALRDPSLPPSDRTLQRWYDVSAFALPALYTAGNAGRGLIYGPGSQSFNVTFTKRFYGFGSEFRNLEFRGEFYNLFNTPIYGNPNVTVDSPTAGRITSASNQREVQLSLKFHF